MHCEEVGHKLKVTFKSNRFGRILAREKCNGLPVYLFGRDAKSLIGDTYFVEVVRITESGKAYLVRPVMLISSADGLHDLLRPYDYRCHGYIRTAVAELQKVTREFGKLSPSYIDAALRQSQDKTLPRAYRLDVARKAYAALQKVVGYTDSRLIRAGLLLVRDLLSQNQHERCLHLLVRIINQIEAIDGKEHHSLVPILETLRDCHLALGNEKSAIKTAKRINKIKSTENKDVQANDV